MCRTSDGRSASVYAVLNALDFTHAPVRAWFEAAFPDGPTRAQMAAWPAIHSGASTLLLAPTGSGKTLAAFLVALNRLMFTEPPSTPVQPPKWGRRPPKVRDQGRCRILYISPLKALGVDVERNLRAPLSGILRMAEKLNHPVRKLSVGIRSGDTPASERQSLARNPPDILITTPESLYLMLTSNARESLRGVETVIIDEIHALAPTKRGVHLFLSLERLERLRIPRKDVLLQPQPPLQRVGLSATQRPLEEIARLLSGGYVHEDTWVPRVVKIIDAGEKKALDIKIEIPAEKPAQPQVMTLESSTDGDHDIYLEPEPDGQAATRTSIWPLIHPRLVELIRAHRSTLLFVNSRRLAERLAAAINDLAEGEICLAHHGSLSKEARSSIEDRLKRGTLPALVATSSLELGIDMGAIDLVVQIEAPPSVASGLQRIGRAGHNVGATSKGVIFPKFRGDLLACAAVSTQMLEGQVEETYYPRNTLDVLAQQMVAIVGMEDIAEQELYTLVRSAAPFSELPLASFHGVLDMLSGRYPSEEFSELRPRLTWDRINGQLTTRRGAQRIAVVNAGTIPDRGLYGVFLSDSEKSHRVGELDEEMVFESNIGEVFLLGASSWRIEDVTHDRVLVSPAPGEPGKMPFWRGDRLGRTAELGRSIGKLAHRLSRMPDGEAKSVLIDDHHLESEAAHQLITYLREQEEKSALPTDRHLVLERFTDEIGDWRVVVMTPFGARVHAPWATAVSARLRAHTGLDIDTMWTDDGMAFRLLETDRCPEPEIFFPGADEVEELVTKEVGQTSLFAAHFRENAGRALLLPKRSPGRRTPLWAQRRRSSNLLEIASKYSSFPIILETYRECLRDIFDIDELKKILQAFARRQIRLSVVDTKAPSPFAASVLFTYVANFIYDGDAPLAEKRAQALAIDHTQLQALLGAEELRNLLDPDVIEEVERTLLRLNSKYLVHHRDAIHDLLIQLGDLSSAELKERVRPELRNQLENWIHTLASDRRIIQIQIAGTSRWAAVEDAARLRDALGIVLPPGLPEAFLEPGPDPLTELIRRYARTHTPFRARDCCERFGVGIQTIETRLKQLEEQERVVSGAFLPRGTTIEWCDTDVLQRLKRRSLARLRAEVEPVHHSSLGRFLPEWHGLHQPQANLDAVLNSVELLQGAPLPASDLDTSIMPARVKGYRPMDLDELCAAGEIIWQGIEPLGLRDGRIALYLADRFAELSPPPIPAEGELCQLLREIFSTNGAQFFSDLASRTGRYPQDIADALWQLVWAGEVTNDTLRPLRARLGSPHRTHHRPSTRITRGFRSRRKGPEGTEGRWSLLPSRTLVSVTDTARRTAQAHQLLSRHGVLTREAASSEIPSGGFSSIYPILKAMESAGKIRRGYFIEGLGATQFALPGAEDRLRGYRDPPPDDEPSLYMLAATDPANPYGAALAWPHRTDGIRAQRTAGAQVVLSGGQLVGYLGRSETALLTFGSEQDGGYQALASALSGRVKSGARSFQLISKIDGSAPNTHPISSFLQKLGFRKTTKGLLLRLAQ